MTLLSHTQSTSLDVTTPLAARMAPPEGMSLNADGGYTPTHLIRPQRLLEDQLVNALLAEAVRLREQLAEFRGHAFEEVDTFIGVLAEKYDGDRGGAKGNTTLTSYDGLRRVQVATGDFITFGPELQIAKNLVDTCLSAWSEGANENIKAIINDAFDVGKEGKIRVDRVLALRGLHIEDEAWVRAMGAIGDAIRVTHSKRYVRFYVREGFNDQWTQVSLDFSRGVS